MKRGRKRRRCRYYVNTNFVVDLLEGRWEAIEFARRRKGLLCTSRVLLHEFRTSGRLTEARRACRIYGIAVYKLGKKRSWIAARLEEVLANMPRISPNTLLDWVHIYAAKALGATYFVTADRAACRRAIRAGLCCINYREGWEKCP